MHSERNVLTSPAFVTSVALLLANDFLLKRLYPGLITGKLSDFAGLFAFATFFSELMPNLRLAVHAAVAAAFVVWKSPAADPLIEAWSLPLQRVLDPTDLLALAVLPFSHRYCGRERPRSRWPILRPLMAGVALFSFAATSYYSPVDYSVDFIFDGSAAELQRRLQEREIRLYPIDPSTGAAAYHLHMPAPGFCFGHIDGILHVREEGDRLRVSVRKLAHRCPRARKEKEKMLQIFREQVAVPLNLQPARPLAPP